MFAFENPKSYAIFPTGMRLMRIVDPEASNEIDKINRELEAYLDCPKFKPSFDIDEHVGEVVGGVDEGVE